MSTRLPLSLYRAAWSLPLVLLSLTGAAAADEMLRSVTITGAGEVSRAPDMATMSIGVTTIGKTAAEALSANSTLQSSVIETLKGAGIAASDMQTSGLNIGPQYPPSRDDKAEKMQSFHASNMLQIRIHDLDNLGALLDEAVTSGATDFGGLSFGLADRRDAEDEARKLAVADARKKAELYAAALGLKLGPVLHLRESNGYSGQPMMEYARSAAMAPPVETGELAIAAQVSVEYALEAAE